MLPPFEVKMRFLLPEFQRMGRREEQSESLVRMKVAVDAENPIHSMVLDNMLKELL